MAMERGGLKDAAIGYGQRGRHHGRGFDPARTDALSARLAHGLSWLGGGRPPTEPLSIRGFAVGDGITATPDLPRAGDWASCGPTCERAAYMATIYPTYETAAAAIPALARKLSEDTRPSDPAALTEQTETPLAFHIFEIEAVDFKGRDYRRRGCAIPKWHDQLLRGDRYDPAWREIERQRVQDEIEGVLLPGDELFLFLKAAERLVRKESLETVLWSGDA